MTAETYLRRALFAPLIVPLLAIMPMFLWDKNRASGSAEGNALQVSLFLLYSFCAGGIPYATMLSAKRQEVKELSGEELEAHCKKLPLEMLPYFWKFWGILTVILLVTFWGFIAGVIVLLVGTFAVPILGYAYVAVTFAFLRGFQWLGLVEK